MKAAHSHWQKINLALQQVMIACALHALMCCAVIFIRIVPSESTPLLPDDEPYVKENNNEKRKLLKIYYAWFQCMLKKKMY